MSSGCRRIGCKDGVFGRAVDLPNDNAFGPMANLSFLFSIIYFTNKCTTHDFNIFNQTRICETRNRSTKHTTRAACIYASFAGGRCIS